MKTGKSRKARDEKPRPGSGGSPLKVLLIKSSTVGAAYRPPEPPAVTAPLGILYLASFLRRSLDSRVQVELESLSTAVRSLDEIPSFLAGRHPDVLGISSTMAEEREAVELARQALRMEPRPVVVIGGPYATCSTRRSLRNTGADWAVTGEGERVFAAFIGSLLDGGRGAPLPGTARLDSSGNLNSLPPDDFVADLDSLPHPAWDLVPIPVYSKMFNMNDMPTLLGPYAPMMTSRGCPYRCTFCHNIFGRTFRARTPGNVLEEMELLHDTFGVREFHFIDDVFNFDGDRVEAICNLIIARGLKIALAFPNAIRGDILTRRQIRLLQRAGCYSITMALESAVPRLQKLMRKNLDLRKIARNTRYASSLGMITSCFVMLGYPGETEEEMEATVRWVRDSAFDFLRLGIASPFPGTAMAEHARKAGIDPETLDTGRAQYDPDNPGLTRMPAEKFRLRYRSAIEEICREKGRRRRIEAVWSRWDRSHLPYFGISPLRVKNL